jgi:hypothetical protein
MIDSEQLIEYAKHPELALRNLEQLLPLLDSDDETEQGCVSDLLENCGAPALSHVPFLCAQLKSGLAPRVYWASTLLGRLGANESLDRSRLHFELCGVLKNESFELSARERAAWAIGETKPIDRVCRTVLEEIVEKAPARLKRLLENALDN